MKDRSLGEIRTMSESYLSCSSLTQCVSRPRNNALVYGIEDAAANFGPGNFASGLKCIL